MGHDRITLMKVFYFIALLVFSAPFLYGQAWKGEINPDLPALKKKAEGGDAAAKAEYAFHSMRCMGGLKFQPDLIFKYFTESAEAGNHDGLVGLAHCYCFNVGTTRNARKASELIAEPFKKHHPVAQKITAFLHYGIQGVKPRDLKKVREFNAMSAEQGCIAALFNLGIESTREGPEQDIKKGMEIFRRLHEKQLFPMASAELFEHMLDHEVWEDQKDLFRDCLAQVKIYAELQEPSTLFSLAKFYRQAGDLETAIGYYTQSANFGNGYAWYELWRLNYYGDKPKDGGNLWVSGNTPGNLALKAYERGVFINASLEQAAWEITRQAGKKEQQMKLPLLERELLSRVPNHCGHHDALGRVYLKANQKLHPQLAKKEWALNHFIAHSHHHGNAASELALYYFFKAEKTPQNLAKGYVSAVTARTYKNHYWSQKWAWEKALKLMTPEAKEQAEKLTADQWPAGVKHRRKAEDFLIKIGHLPPRK